MPQACSIAEAKELPDRLQGAGMLAANPGASDYPIRLGIELLKHGFEPRGVTVKM